MPNVRNSDLQLIAEMAWSEEDGREEDVTGGEMGVK